ncbi:acyltransferase [Catenulispora yoronensis]|uniref:Acyltransferase n=1 Tax=Catenulispora yoronensis TaxID=450799 RepID=A0ABN2UR43_9ACTN
MGPSNSSIAASRLPSLTGLRWLAALMVFAGHIGTEHVFQSPTHNRDWTMAFGEASSGVSFFFVLSGFVLVWSARSGDSPLRFWRRRVAKIYPSHVVMWGVAVLVAMLCWHDAVRPDYAVGNLFLLQPWINVVKFSYSFDKPSWSLGCEAFFYLLFPFLLPLVKRASARVVQLIAIAIPVLMELSTVWATDHMSYLDGAWFTYMFPPVRSLEFLLGMLVAELALRGRWRGPKLGAATVIVVAAYLATRSLGWFPLSMPERWWMAGLAAAYAVLIAAAAQADMAGTRSLWRHPVLVWLGEVSFGFYLVHAFFINGVMRAFGRENTGWSTGVAVAMIPVFLAVSIFLASLLHRYVELPMMRWIGPKRARGKRPAPAAARRREVPVSRGERIPIEDTKI